jgi:hypothetical protein
MSIESRFRLNSRRGLDAECDCGASLPWTTDPKDSSATPSSPERTDATTPTPPGRLVRSLSCRGLPGETSPARMPPENGSANPAYSARIARVNALRAALGAQPLLSYSSGMPRRTLYNNSARTRWREGRSRSCRQADSRGATRPPVDSVLFGAAAMGAAASRPDSI